MKLGLHNLKKSFSITSSKVECPTHGCSNRVRRRKRGEELGVQQHACETCNIFIYPSTYQYYDYTDNLLWKKADDMQLLKAIKTFKAESRLERENSEDAVTWNVFRYFDKTKQLNQLASLFTANGLKHENTEIAYWSYSQQFNSPWEPLLDARVMFGEAASHAIARLGKRVTEPDVILITNDTVIFIEAKFGASNKTSGNQESIDKKVGNSKRYLSGGDRWFKKVFRSSYEKVIKDQKYELLRHWLLGSWIANKLGKRFLLVNLVLDSKEKKIEIDFGQHISQETERSFKRFSWESIYHQMIADVPRTTSTENLRKYFHHKTIGFAEVEKEELARPRRAFTI